LTVKRSLELQSSLKGCSVCVIISDLAIVLLVIFLVSSRIVPATSRGHNVTIYYNGRCPLCQDYVNALEYALYSANITNVTKLDYSINATAYDALKDLRHRIDVPSQFFSYITTLVDEKYVFVGYFPIDIIIDFVRSDPNLDKLIAAQGLEADTYRVYSDGVVFNCDSSTKISECLPFSTIGTQSMWLLVLVSGLVDGFNPCAFSVLAYFVGIVAMYRSRKGIFLAGSLYIMSMYLFYLGIGLGLTYAIELSGKIWLISKILGVIIAGVGLVALIGALSESILLPRMSTRLFLPIATRFSSSWVQKSTIFAALLFGGLVAAIEFPCTGGIYIATVGILSAQGVDWLLVQYLLVYNFMFIMPLIVILVMLSGIVGSSSLEERIRRKRHLMGLVSGPLMIGLGIFLLLA